MIHKNLTESSRYIIFTSFIYNEEEIYKLEMTSLLGFIPENNYFFSDIDIDLERSIYFRSKIHIMYKAKTISEIEDKIVNDNLTIDGYKIIYQKTNNKVNYNERINALRVLGTAIHGDFMIKDPNYTLALTKIGDYFVFGYLDHNMDLWKSRINKPYNYSFSLEVKLAKSILNIIVGNDLTQTIIDPCCGVGTVLVEGKCMSMNIIGNDIVKLVHHQCNFNLKHYGFKPTTTNKDIKDIEESYDIAILDLPYGHFAYFSDLDKLKLLNETKRISKKALIVSNSEISKLIISTGYNITKQAKIKKTNTFSRFIYEVQ